MDRSRQARSRYVIGQAVMVASLFVMVLFAQTVFSAWHGPSQTTATSLPPCGYGYSIPCPTPTPICGYGYSIPCPTPTPACGYGYSIPCPTPTPACGYGYGIACPTPTPICGFGYGVACPTPTPICGFGYGGCATPTPIPTSTPISPAHLKLLSTVVTPFQKLFAVGSGFGSGAAVALYWDRVTTMPLLLIKASSAGSFLAAITVPQSAAGSHVVIAVAVDIHRSAGAVVTVQPVLTINPSGGLPGARIAVQGFGFGARESVRLIWSAPLGSLATAHTGTNGSFGVTLVTIPLNATRGTDLIIGTGQTTHSKAIGVVKVS